ncbi:hypothetical protein GOODEAATRI_033139 [Goodea atripinnis]|uniref:Maturase K n=1 Tax=Goodea atripinnis TaxID=208336 RepID=A0ABV0NQ46_9TELE
MGLSDQDQFCSEEQLHQLYMKEISSFYHNSFIPVTNIETINMYTFSYIRHKLVLFGCSLIQGSPQQAITTPTQTCQIPFLVQPGFKPPNQRPRLSPLRHRGTCIRHGAFRIISIVAESSF